MGDTIMKLKNVAKGHHSLSDWTFDPRGAWHISAEHYVSPPSSLSCYSSEVGGYRWCFLKPDLYDYLNEGRFVSQLYFHDTATGYIDIFFRCIAVPTDTNPRHTYGVRIVENQVVIFRCVDGVWSSLLIAVPPDPPQENVWEHWRVTFWHYQDASLNWIFRIVVEKEVDEAWKEQAAVEDPDDLWFDAEEVLCGFQLQRNNIGMGTHLDDTEIWKRVI